MNSSADQPQGSVPVHDRRKNPRFPVKVQIELRQESDDIPLRGETTDLSRGGCYLQLSFTLALGTYVQGRVWLDSAKVEFRGCVVTAHAQFGNGIMFMQFEGNGEQVLGSYLDSIVV